MSHSNTYNTKELKAQHKADMERQVDLRLTNGDLHFITDFVKNTAFYVETLEEHIGEDLHDFWQKREHSLRILTDWMLQSLDEELLVSKAA